MPLHADLYLDRIDLHRYADTEMCRVCQVDSLEELLDRSVEVGPVCAAELPLFIGADWVR